jgi:hypothetical protein
MVASGVKTLKVQRAAAQAGVEVDGQVYQAKQAQTSGAIGAGWAITAFLGMAAGIAALYLVAAISIPTLPLPSGLRSMPETFELYKQPAP